MLYESTIKAFVGMGYSVEINHHENGTIHMVDILITNGYITPFSLTAVYNDAIGYFVEQVRKAFVTQIDSIVNDGTLEPPSNESMDDMAKEYGESN